MLRRVARVPLSLPGPLVGAARADPPRLFVRITRRAGVQTWVVVRTVAITPYTLEMIADDVRRAGADAAIDVAVRADVPADALALVERTLARLRQGGAALRVARRPTLDSLAPPGDAGPDPLTLRIAKLTIWIGELLHELQAEHGLSLLHVLSGASRHRECQMAWALTDDVVAQVATFVASFRSDVPPAGLRHLVEALALLDERRAVRAAVLAAQMTAREIDLRYGRTGALLLASLEDLAPAIAGSELGRLLGAHRALLHAEHETARERACGATALAGGGSRAPALLSSLRAAQHVHLAEFAASSPPEASAALRDCAADPEFVRAERLERLIAEAGAQLGRVSSDDWFWTLTAKLTHLKAIEDLDARLVLSAASG